MLIVNHYNYLPGACGLCLSSNLPAVDTTVDLDWPNSPDEPNPSANRRLYICADCCVNLAQLVQEFRPVEIHPKGAYALVVELNQQLSQKNAILHTRLTELETAVSMINSINSTAIVVEEQPAIDVTGFTVAPPPKGKK